MVAPGDVDIPELPVPNNRSSALLSPLASARDRDRVAVSKPCPGGIIICISSTFLRGRSVGRRAVRRGPMPAASAHMHHGHRHPPAHTPALVCRVVHQPHPPEGRDTPQHQ